MNSAKQLKADVITKLFAQRISSHEACALLSKSERTIQRYLKQYRRFGISFVKHGNTGREPINKTNNELKKQVLQIVQSKYFDFNLTHCREQLLANEKIEIKKETFRKWCHQIKNVKKAKRRSAKARMRRERMGQEGLMLQMDGSPHRWFGGKNTCLIGAIDDATSEVPYAEFFLSEDTLSCMGVLQKIIEKKGLFSILYTDRAGIFGGNKRAQFAQVKRALEELGIQIIFANSAQAKGRIERLWGTMQDRIIPEMRLKNITSFEAANYYLQNEYLPNYHNKELTVIPTNPITAYRPLPATTNLQEIFCIKEHRQVASDHTISWDGKKYLVKSPLKYSIYKQKIELRTYQDLKWKAFFANKEIELSLVVENDKLLAA